MPRREDAPRDLLFGLLALQNGVVTRDQLVAAFGAWTAAPARRLADLLGEHGALRPEHRMLLDALADVHLERHGGDAEKSLASLPLNRSTRDSLAAAGGPDLEATLGHVGSSPDFTEDSDRTASYAVGTATSGGQRFRVLRPHARGGLGEVFVALDSELNREVALKKILDGHTDDASSRQRFLIEAEVTGGLEHPGIVPVYGLGTYASGRPYYARRLIRGDSLARATGRFHDDESLKSATGRRSLELRKLLRRFLDVCNAIDYAHSRGVLNRGIKRGNVIVGRHGETLVVDWGLAKATGKGEPGAEEQPLTPSSSGGSSETLPGSALGTPAYMSPEQARGELVRLGPQSDVYGLGATLYRLLTGHPPVEGDDVGDLLGKVERGEFARPRQLDPAIDSALEAICLKAIALQPGDRYPSCRALADDVERWMADERVGAWEEPWTRSLLRWLTRHRTGVTAAAVGLLVALVGTATVLAVQTRANGDLQRANRELASSRDREVARFGLAMEAVRAFHTGVSEDVLLKQGELSALRSKLLGEARRFYGKLQAMLRDQTDAQSLRALARAYHGLGEITREVGSKDQALTLQREALSLQQSLSRETGGSLEVKADLGRSHQAIGEVLRDMGRAEEGLAELAQGISLLEEVARASPGDARVQVDLMSSYDTAGHLLLYEHRYDARWQATARCWRPRKPSRRHIRMRSGSVRELPQACMTWASSIGSPIAGPRLWKRLSGLERSPRPPWASIRTTLRPEWFWVSAKAFWRRS
jgi:serine/threonine-protein kinase